MSSIFPEQPVLSGIQKHLSADDRKMLRLFATKKNNIGLWLSRLFYMKRFRPTWSWRTGIENMFAFE